MAVSHHPGTAATAGASGAVHPAVGLARRLASEVTGPAAAAADRTATFPNEGFRAAAEAGLVGLAIPADCGGLDLPLPVQAEVVEALAGGCAAVVGAVIGSGIQAALPIVRAGSEELRRRYLPRLARGEIQGAFAITEAEAGSDAAALRCRAEEVRGGWRLHGEKTMVNRASLSRIAIVFATVDASLGARGVTAFLVDLHQDGVAIGAPHDKMGQRGLPTEPVVFDGAPVAEDHVLGTVGGGFRLMMATLNHARMLVAANAVGRMSAALDHALAHTRQRHQFGRPLIEIDAVQAVLADMAITVEEARGLTRLAATELSWGGERAALYTAMAKLRATDGCVAVCNEAVKLCGGWGYTTRHPVERMMRDAVAGQIVDGSNSLQKTIVARELIKRSEP